MTAIARKRLEALPEAYALMYFWMMVRKTDDRLAMLQQMAEIVIQRPADWDFAAVRQEHQRGGQPWWSGEVSGRQCFCCASVRRLYRHHIIEVQHGGSNDGRNQVPLCFACHKRIHPWLTVEPPQTHRFGFETFREVFPRLGVGD